MRYLLFCLALLLAGCGETEKFPTLPSGSVVLALGDSLTAGAGVSPGQAWPALLATSTGWQVVNGGVNGNTSADALKRLPALLEEHRPALVLLTLGGNDMLRRLPRQQIEENLRRMIVRSKAEGAQVVLLATPEPSLTGAVLRNLSAPEFYRQIAQAHQVPLIEDAIAEVLSDPLLKGDQIHPNAEGHAILSMKILDELRHYGYAN